VFLSFLKQHDAAAWQRTVEAVLPHIHDVDRRATQTPVLTSTQPGSLCLAGHLRVKVSHAALMIASRRSSGSSIQKTRPSCARPRASVICSTTRGH